jgi:hypothetical protein
MDVLTQKPRAPLSAKPENVRAATPADEAALYDLLVRLHHHNSDGWSYPFNPVLVSRQIEVGTRPNPDTRTEPRDKRLGMIGIIDDPMYEGFAGTVGIFLQQPMWFSDVLVPTELWLYVEPRHRGHGNHYEADLMAFAKWVQATMKASAAMAEYGAPFPLLTGFMHLGARYPAMQRRWLRLCGGKQVGSLFMVE